MESKCSCIETAYCTINYSIIFFIQILVPWASVIAFMGIRIYVFLSVFLMMAFSYRGIHGVIGLLGVWIRIFVFLFNFSSFLRIASYQCWCFRGIFRILSSSDAFYHDDKAAILSRLSHADILSLHRFLPSRFAVGQRTNCFIATCHWWHLSARVGGIEGLTSLLQIDMYDRLADFLSGFWRGLLLVENLVRRRYLTRWNLSFHLLQTIIEVFLTLAKYYNLCHLDVLFDRETNDNV